MPVLSTKIKYYTQQQCNENEQIMFISVWKTCSHLKTTLMVLMYSYL